MGRTAAAAARRTAAARRRRTRRTATRQEEEDLEHGEVHSHHQEEDYSHQVHRPGLVDHQQHGNYHEHHMSRLNQVQQ